MIDEGPSSEDLERFGGEDSALCPDCGAEIWDQAEYCSKCSAYVGGNTSRRSPEDRWLQQRWIGALVVLLIAGLLSCYVWFRWF